MQRKINLNEKEIEYTLKISKRAKKMRLAVYCDGNFVVTAPQNMGENIIERFIIQKSRWVLDKLEYFKNNSGKRIVVNSQKEYIENKAKALSIAHERVEYFNQFYGFKFNRISIKNQKTRWGSCSKKGNLNFNYKIALIPEYLADYIVVHELCHLKELNHSQRFWNLVAKVIPDYLGERKELRKIGIGFA